ncbi:1-phosphofructokinase family hexose kinase [Ornithinimicrobium sp. W1665]|uniref:1-phosphofructokinase family hexose kinase n=1 Tax=Ornithinimicrobium sp. W1665 TaxID=3416666 RepID=UPI003CEBA354
MIITLTPNPAIDVTYRVPSLRPGASHRITDLHRRPGGKGVNAAGVLARVRGTQRGSAAVTCASAVDEASRAWWDSDLAARGIRPETVAVAPPWRTRTSTTVVQDDGTATVLNEAGDTPDEQVWRGLVERVSGLGAAARGATGPRAGRAVLAICGSLPGAAQDSPPGSLLELAARFGGVGALVVDGSGPWLTAVLATRPALVKPNADEAAATTGEDDPLRAAEALVRSGARAAMVSAGADGLVLVLDDGRRWSGRPGRVLRGNPTGAGDAATAAAASYLAQHDPADDPEALLRQVVAWSGAAVLHPHAGDLDPDHLSELGALAGIERI